VDKAGLRQSTATYGRSCSAQRLNCINSRGWMAYDTGHADDGRGHLRTALQRMTRTEKDPVRIRRAIAVMMFGQGQAVRDITSLLQVSADHVGRRLPGRIGAHPTTLECSKHYVEASRAYMCGAHLRLRPETGPCYLLRPALRRHFMIAAS